MSNRNRFWPNYRGYDLPFWAHIAAYTPVWEWNGSQMSSFKYLEYRGTHEYKPYYPPAIAAQIRKRAVAFRRKGGNGGRGKDENK